MSWTIKQHKRGNNTSEIEVSMIVKDMYDHQSTTAEGWIHTFENRVKNEVKITNTFSAEFGYKAKQIDTTSIEIWKMKTNGDFNYLMFTVTKD